MSEAIMKAVKWYVLAFCTIVGASAFIIADDTGSIKPIMAGILGFGMVYILSVFWKDFRGKPLFLSVVVFLALSVVSRYVPMGMFILFGYDINAFDPYYTWAAITAAFGIPVMSVLFYKYD